MSDKQANKADLSLSVTFLFSEVATVTLTNLISFDVNYLSYQQEGLGLKNTTKHKNDPKR